MIMPDADQSREKASHCRKLALETDTRTAQSLEMLAVEYDEDARVADIETENEGAAEATPGVQPPPA